MLAKPLYETLPYGYFLFGLFFIVFGNSLTPILIGCAFYLMGANIWRMRSTARRKDHRINRKNCYKRIYYYEFKPFLLLLSGLLLASHINEALSAAIGVTTCFVAILILTLRVLNRRSRSLV